jgi:hypothetical protein
LPTVTFRTASPIIRRTREQLFKFSIVPAIAHAMSSEIPTILVGFEQWAPDLGDTPQPQLLNEILRLIEAHPLRPSEEVWGLRHLIEFLTPAQYREMMGDDAAELMTVW